MQNLSDIISEKLHLNKSTSMYSCQPQNTDELRTILEKRLAKNKNADLNDIDVSGITNMYNLFNTLDPHNIDVSEWDVSNVTNMRQMFYGCTSFDCDLSNWDVSKVEDMWHMFEYCNKFEGNGLENWNISKVTNMNHMFKFCHSLKNKPSWYKGIV